MEPSFNIGVKFAESRKKRKDSALEDNIGNKKFAAAKVLSGRSWNSEASDTTESDSVNMEEKCLIEGTSFDHEDGRVFAGEDSEQTPKSLKILTKRTLRKLLRKINFLGDVIDNVLLNEPMVLPPLLKTLVNVSVKKSFTLDISLNNITGKSAQEKLVVVRKLFSKINGFGGASTPSKFAGIVRVTFTSKLSLALASKKAEEVKILVNSNLKKSSEHSDRAVRLYVLCYPNYVASVGGKTCIIDCHPVSYVWARCTTVCFDSAESLNTVMEITPVLKGANLCWSCLVSAKCARCGKLGHTSLVCSVSGKKNVLSGVFLHKTLSNLDKSRLAAIYVKHLAPVACPVSFGGILWAQIAGGSSFLPPSVQNVLLKAGFSPEMKSTLLVSLELDNRFAALEHSLVSLAEHVDMLAKKLETPEPMVSQLSPGRQPLVTSLSQNQRADIVISESSGVATGGETVVGVVVFDSAVISKMEETLNSLLLMVISLSAKLNNAGSVSTPLSSQ
ncbi:hypothetical protein G9A89_020374 [Geosiphon pyriformis]|nr:hypothetical protein G9A89_020374 [Geosiphon pyriformis]